MKKLLKLFLVMILAGTSGLALAQNPKLPGLDTSPADLALLREGRNDDPYAKIIYSRPQKKGRETFASNGNSLAPFGKVWRTGANETTEMIVYKSFKLGGVEVEPGTYSVYTIPGEKEWTLILNNKLNTWGHFSYDESFDKYKITGEVKPYEPLVEAFTIYFDGIKNNKSTLYMAWDTTIVIFPIEL